MPSIDERKVSSSTVDYKWEFMLYPDTTDYEFEKVIKYMMDYFDEWAWVVHDKDTLPDGSIKKTHVHFIGQKVNKSTSTLAGMAYRFGLDEKWVEPIRTWKGANRYLIHYHNEDITKFEYSPDAVHCNYRYEKYLDAPSESDMAKQIFAFIMRKGGYVTSNELVEYCLKENLYSALRRGMCIWREYLIPNTSRNRLIHDEEF